MNILIVEDDVLISEELSLLLEDLDHTVLHIAPNAEKAISFLKSGIHVDLIFLDITMNGRPQGFDVAQYIDENTSIPYIFLTSHADKLTVQDAAKFNSLTYLLKPFTHEMIYATVEIHKEFIEKANKRKIILKDGITSAVISINDVMFVKSDDVYIEIHTKNSRITTRNSLKGFANTYFDNNFQQIHRSYIVNVNFISKYSSTSLFIESIELPISRTFKNEIFEYLESR